MSLRTHIIARTWTPEGTASLHVETLCGEPGFKAARIVQPRNEWEAGRRLGGMVAVPEPEFFPDHNACKRCQAKWAAAV